MNAVQQFTLSGVALPRDATHMLDQMCEHFVEHAEVQRSPDLALLKSKFGTACIRRLDEKLLIDLDCPSETALQMTRTSIAEHMFYFAGEDVFELNWSEPLSSALSPKIHQVTVTAVENVTPHMRRVKLACADVTPFIGGDMHVRILVPPKGRQPVWPGYREDGRIAWPQGKDKLLVRVYTIRAVDAERGELWIDFLQHPLPGIPTPGADFARDCQPGDRLALLGPGGGSLPGMDRILLIGDESALPAIARIAAEVPVGTRMQAIIEVEDAGEEQPLPTAGSLDIRWLHRKDYRAGAKCVLADTAKTAIAAADSQSFVWVAGEKEDVRSVRAFLKSRKHDRKAMYVAWYWERNVVSEG
jgi:NADPH-dependent ferric siderophore reductase